jgi:hypothetical protein
MDAPKTIKYTNSLGELQLLDPNNYKMNSDTEGYFKKYDEFQQECIRKFNIMYDENYILRNNIQLTDDEKEYIEKTKNVYETQHIHQIPMLSRH